MFGLNMFKLSCYLQGKSVVETYDLPRDFCIGLQAVQQDTKFVSLCSTSFNTGQGIDDSEFRTLLSLNPPQSAKIVKTNINLFCPKQTEVL